MPYFHIDSCYAPAGKRFLEVGETIRTGSRTFNPYYEQMCSIHHVIPVDGRDRRLKELLASPEIARFSSRDLARNFHGVIDTYIRLVREMEFENVRRDQFPGRPSRTRCIWVSDDLDKARYWRDRLEKTSSTRIVQVEVDGNVCEVDGRHLSAESSSLVELRAAAQRYWKGTLHHTPEKEILLEGSMTAVKIIEV